MGNGLLSYFWRNTREFEQKNIGGLSVSGDVRTLVLIALRPTLCYDEVTLANGDIMLCKKS